MTLTNRISKLEQTALFSAVEQIKRSIGKIADSELDVLNRMFVNEMRKRGLIEPPEIEAAREYYKHLLAKGLTERERRKQLYRRRLNGATK